MEYKWVKIHNAPNKYQLVPQEIIDWYPVEGQTDFISYPFGSIWSQIYAGFGYPRDLIEKILPITNLSKLQEFKKSKNQIIYTHDMNIAMALEKINSRLQDIEQSRAIKFIKQKYYADHVKLSGLDINLHLADLKLYSYFIPAYISEIDIENKIKYKIINGYTGDIFSNKIYSIYKSALFGDGLGGISFLLITLLTKPYIIIGQLLFIIILNSLISGLLSGYIAKFKNIYSDKKYKSQMAFDKKLNFDYLETEDDIQRKKYNISNGQNLLIDKLRLLKLDPETNITLDKLKIAYHAQLKIWHPDLHKNKLVAENMTKQINLAYSELVSLLKN